MGTIALTAGTRGISSAPKAGTIALKANAAKTMAATKNAINKLPLADYLPYSPQLRLAMVDNMPFNAMNGPVVKENLIVKAKVELSGKSTGNAKDITKLTVDDIPTAKSVNFNKFFNALTSKELDELWKDKSIRKKIERQIREPGGLHEWHLVSRAPQFKHWIISAEEIKDLRTAISDVKFVNPTGVHGGLGSIRAHNELLAIIDTSSDYDTFVRRLNNWANYKRVGYHLYRKVLD